MTALMVGITTVDLAYLIESYPREDSKTTAEDQALFAGGPAANAAVAHAALGEGTASLLTALGTHPLTAIPRNDLSSHGVTLHDANPTSEVAPAISSIFVSRTAHTRTLVSRDGLDLSAQFAESHLSLLDHARIVLIDGHHPDVAIRIGRAAHERGIPVVLDVGRHKPIYDELLPITSAAICSEGFRPYGQGPKGPDHVLTYLHESGVQYAAITAGSKPVQFSVADQSPGTIPVPDVDAVDTLGAGDILHGAFCYYFAEGLSFPDALSKAVEIASLSCRYFGARRWIQELPRSASSPR